LRQAGISNAQEDADRLLRHVMSWDRATLLSRPTAAIEPEALAFYLALVDERAKRRPLQHLVGTQAFWRHDFLVTPDVLIPRPETELLVEAGLAALRAAPGAVVVDVGTGTGCLALSLAAERPDAVVHATDVSEAALGIARENARRLGLLDRVHFHQGDLLGPVRSLWGSIDVVVSNPPYVDASEASSLAPEVREHEPALALFAPGDRYSVYRRIAPAGFLGLRPGGILILEVGMGMADEVSRICRASSLEVKRVLDDLQGIPRAIVAERTGSPAAG
jgi:release factor glutamine methyltransferase